MVANKVYTNTYDLRCDLKYDLGSARLKGGALAYVAWEIGNVYV